MRHYWRYFLLLVAASCLVAPRAASAADCGCAEPACGCEEMCCDDMGCEYDPSCGCESGCDSMGGCGGGSCLSGSCLSGCGDDPFSLFGDVGCLTIGGWTQIGYHSAGSGSRFNSRPDDLQLHQAWLYVEKAIDTSEGFDIGGRVDYIYGTDSQDTQAFGIANDHWDNDWDNGPDYGHALPQAYIEAGYGDLTVKAGHFYTIIGWEVVTAPDNFFYSHAYTMYNSEPFTHTGALATYQVSDDLSVFGGYTFGWDSGFEDNGDNFIGGFSAGLCDGLTMTYATVAGRFVEGTTLERGYMHSIVFDAALSDNLQYIFQSDWLSTEDNVGTTVRETIGVNQYLIYSINDCVSAGGRFEWWNVEDAAGNKSDVYDLTLGVNVKPHSNIIVRPEVRWDWDGSATQVGVNENNASSQTTFGVDSIFLF